MGQDIRPHDLENITNISNKLDYKLLLEKSGIIETLQIDLSDLINQNSKLVDDSIIYNIITPKNFLSTIATETELGVIKKASASDVTNRTANKILCCNNILDAMLTSAFNINMLNITKYKEYESLGALASINIFYHNKYGKNVSINGQIVINVYQTTNVYAIYFKYFNLPKSGFSAGSALSLLYDGSNFADTICRAKTIDGWLLELAFNRTGNFIKDNTYILDFSINYNI